MRAVSRWQVVAMQHMLLEQGRYEEAETLSTWDAQFENNHFAEMCSGSEAGSYLRLIDLAGCDDAADCTGVPRS